MAAYENIAIVRRYFEESMNRGNLAILDELVADDYCESNTVFSHTPGRDHLKQAIRHLRAALPDLRFTVNAIVAQGDEVEVFTISEATIPTQDNRTQPYKKVRMAECHVMRIAGGQIVEHSTRQSARLEMWDVREGWLPLSPSRMSAYPAVH